MILNDTYLRKRLREFIPEGFDPLLINPASVDIRIGSVMLLETGCEENDGFERIVLPTNPSTPFFFPAKAFALVETLEVLQVPNGHVVESKLKSSRAREGWNHSLSFHFDPGWYGKGTLEIINERRFKDLPIYCGMRFVQIIIHQTVSQSESPYRGRYNNATGVEMSRAINGVD